MNVVSILKPMKMQDGTELRQNHRY